MLAKKVFHSHSEHRKPETEYMYKCMRFVTSVVLLRMISMSVLGLSLMCTDTRHRKTHQVTCLQVKVGEGLRGRYILLNITLQHWYSQKLSSDHA